MAMLDHTPFYLALGELSDDWLRTPRTKEDILRALFGDNRHITYLPIPQPDGWTLHGYLLTGEDATRLLTFFQSDPRRWHHPSRPVPQASDVRAHLQDVIRNLRGGDTLADLVRWHADAATVQGNTQAATIAPALFDAWLAEQDLTDAAAAAVRTLAALSWEGASDLMAEIETVGR